MKNSCRWSGLSLAIFIIYVFTGFASFADEGDNTGKAFPFSELGQKAAEKADSSSLGIKAVDSGAEIVCKLQALEALVTPSGISFRSTSDTEGRGTFSMKVTGLGRAGRDGLPSRPFLSGGFGETALPSEATVSVSKDCVQIVRPEMVEEFTVSGDGIRQDFIVSKKPEGNGELTFAVGLSGATAKLSDPGLTLRLTETGRQFAYSKLLVTDAAGKKLLAEFKINSRDEFIVSVDDSNAVYPIRIDPTISDDNWVGMGMNGTVYALAYDSSGNLYAGGSFIYAGGLSANHVAKWNGSAWSALGSGLNADVHALACNSSGTLYAGGNFTFNTHGDPTNFIAAWNGSSWSALGTGMNYPVSALACDSSGAIYAGGAFTVAGGVALNYVAKWNGNAWSALGAHFKGVDSNVNALAFDSSGNLYAGGYFTSAGGVSANHVAKWNGTVWSSLGSGTSLSVNALVCDTSGTLYAGGLFATVGGVSANNIAKWDGYTWSVLESGMRGTVNTLVRDSSGNIYAGGNFWSAGEVLASSIAKWDGSSWSALGSGINGTVNALVRDSSGNIYAGGNFTTAGGKASAYLAKCIIQTYTLSFTTGGDGSINGTTPQTVWYGGNSSSVTAVPDEGYHFVNWSGSYTGTQNPLTLTNITANKSVTANFAINIYSVVFTAGANGYMANSSILGPNTQAVNHGANCIPVTAVPNANYHFTGWSGGYTGNENPLTITNVTSAMNITANFAINTYTVNFASGGNGIVEGTTPQTIDHAKSCTVVTAKPAENYKFVNWTGTNGFVTTTVNPLTVTSVTSAKTITANFAHIQAILTTAKTGNGIVTPATGLQNTATAILIKAVPADGYRFTGWTCSGGATVDGQTENANARLTAVGTVTANFAQNYNSLTISKLGTGTTSPIVGTNNVKTYTPIPISATPGVNCHFEKWTLVSGAGSIAKSNIASTTVTLTGTNGAPVILQAEFAHNTAVLTMANDGNGTTLPVVGTSTIDTATPTPISATATIANYHFEKWTVTNGVTVANATSASTTASLTTNGTVTATFAHDTAVLTMAKVGGLSVTPASKTVNTATAIPITATASNVTYPFFNWTVTGNAVVAAPDSASTTVTLTGNSTVTANFIMPIVNGTAISAISGMAETVKQYKIINVPSCALFEVKCYGGTGDADLTVSKDGKILKYASGSTNNETVQIESPVAGDYIIGLNANTAYSGLTLLAKYYTTKPLPPTGVVASKGTYQDAILVSWAISAGATDYEVWRGDTSISTAVTTTRIGETSDISYFDNKNLVAGKIYYYWVKAKNGAIDGTSAFSAMASGNTLSKPLAPASVTVTNGTYFDKVLLTWPKVIGATTYQLYRTPSPVKAITAVTQAVSADTCVITAYNHGFVSKDKVLINGVAGTIAILLNGKPFEIIKIDEDKFSVPVATSTTAKTGSGGTVMVQTITGASQAISSGSCVVTAPAHDYKTGDSVLITGVVGTLATLLNGITFEITASTTDTFTVTVPLSTTIKTSGAGGTAIPVKHIARLNSEDVPVNVAIQYDSRLTTYSYNDTADDSDQNPNTYNNTYYYWVQAINDNGGSPLKLSASVGSVKKTGPATITASQGTLAEKIRVTWAAVPGSTDYEVTDGAGNNITAVSGLSYDYADSAMSITGATAASQCVITAVAHGLSTGDTILINGVTGTIAPLLNGKFLVIAKTGTDTFSVPINTLLKMYDSGGTVTAKRSFKVRANLKDLTNNVIYTSDFSPTCTGYIYANNVVTLATPVMKSVSKGDYSYIKVMWNEVPLATEYIVYRRAVSESSFKELTTSEKKTYYEDYSGLTPGVTYFYSVIAKNNIKSNASIPMSGYAGYPLAVLAITDNTFSSLGLSGNAVDQKVYQVNIPSGVSRLVVKAENVAGVCDIYAKLGSYPTTLIYNAKGVAVTGKADKTLTITNPAEGFWYILLCAGTGGYTKVDLSINYYTSTDIIFTQVPLSGQNVPFTAAFKGRVVDRDGVGIAGLGVQVRDPVTGIATRLTAMTDATGYFTYSTIITGEGEYTYDFFFTGIPDNTKSIGSWTVKTKKSPNEVNGFFDFSSYLTGTLVELNSVSTPSLGAMQTYMNVRRGFVDEPTDVDSETYWVENTLGVAQSDTGITSKLDSGLYLLFYGTEGAAIGNGMTANPGLTASPLLVHVASGDQTNNVITNLADFIDSTVADKVKTGGIGVVVLTAVNNKDEGSAGIGYDISLFADQQLDLLANLAGGNGVTFDAADDRTYGTTSTRLVKIVIGSRTIGVRVGSFTVVP